MKLTIAAINLQSGAAPTKGYWQYALTGWRYWLPHSDKPIKVAGKMVKEERVDIACITEISEKSLCTGFRSQLDMLAENAEMDHRHFFSTEVPFKILRDEGNAIVSRHQIISSASHPLHKELFNASLDESIIEIEGKKITIFVAHLALTKKHREIQIREIIQMVQGKQGPMILAGDFNERDPAALGVILKETTFKHVCALPTFPSWKPKYPLDYIFLTEEFKAIDCFVAKGKAFSDHCALIVKAEIG